ncbi:MAG: hypothetical protein IPK16_14415 [Anaerolineales bacterium]|nr:hypothetical protein [Anaerolineales bacterium]
MINLQQIQEYLRDQRIDGWLLYDFRGLNPIALYVAGLQTSGSRRWFLWIPAEGEPVWLIHAIEGSTFVGTDPNLNGPKHKYVGWRSLEEWLPKVVRGPTAPQNGSPWNTAPKTQSRM